MKYIIQEWLTGEITEVCKTREDAERALRTYKSAENYEIRQAPNTVYMVSFVTREFYKTDKEVRHMGYEDLWLYPDAKTYVLTEEQNALNMCEHYKIVHELDVQPNCYGGWLYKRGYTWCFYGYTGPDALPIEDAVDLEIFFS